METRIYTKSEVIAYQLLTKGHVNDTIMVNISEYGNKIIELAEQIKAERAVAAINNPHRN